jgi:hypothetical protein
MNDNIRLILVLICTKQHFCIALVRSPEKGQEEMNFNVHLYPVYLIFMMAGKVFLLQMCTNTGTQLQLLRTNQRKIRMLLYGHC